MNRTWMAAALSAALVWSLTGCGDGDEVREDAAASEPTAAPSDPPMRDLRPLRHELVKGAGAAPVISEAELRDLTQLAKSSGQDLDELKARHRGQSQFTLMASSLGGHNQKIWVSSGVSQEGQPGNYWMVFTEKPPQKVFNRLATLGTDTDVIWGAAGNHYELRRVRETVAASLRERGVYASVTGLRGDEYDTSSAIHYSLKTDATVTRAELDEYQSEALHAAAAKFPDGRVPGPVVFVEGPRGDEGLKFGKSG